MGTFLEQCLCLVFGAFLPVLVQSNIQEQVAKLSRADFFEDFLRFSFKRELDEPFDVIFSSRRSRSPDFHTLAELPPHMKIPQIRVLCNGSEMTLLVDKRFNGVVLSDDELQLGDGCNSNGELDNQFVFTYHLNQCGTNHVVHQGLDVFSNLLHFNPRKSLFTWWFTPFALPISCIPNRTDTPSSNPSMAHPKMDMNNDLAIKAMDPSWTHAAQSNIYHRGQMVYLQVTAKTDYNQQLFIQSCFVSASLDPQTRPRQVVILNKGCAARYRPNHAMAQFEASGRDDAVKFRLETSQLPLEVYVHCSVLISDKGLTSSSKACNYNKLQSRWEELSGNVDICNCCSSRCKSPLLKSHHVGARAMISTGRIVIADEDLVVGSQPSGPEPIDPPGTSPILSGDFGPGATEYQTFVKSQPGSGAHSQPKDKLMSSAFLSVYSNGNTIPEDPMFSPLGPVDGVVVLSQDPIARLTLWLAGQTQVPDTGVNDVLGSALRSGVTVPSQLSDALSNDIPELYSIDRDSPLNPSTNGLMHRVNVVGSETPMHSMNILTLLDGWPVSSHLEKTPVLDEPQRIRRSQILDVMKQEGYGPFLPMFNGVEGVGFNQRDEVYEPFNVMETMVRDEVYEPPNVIEAKVIHGYRPINAKHMMVKGIDGSQGEMEHGKLLRQEQETRHQNQQVDWRGLLSTFLDFLRDLIK